jgi:hypothetical protein
MVHASGVQLSIQQSAKARAFSQRIQLDYWQPSIFARTPSQLRGEDATQLPSANPLEENLRYEVCVVLD